MPTHQKDFTLKNLVPHFLLLFVLTCVFFCFLLCVKPDSMNNVAPPPAANFMMIMGFYHNWRQLDSSNFSGLLKQFVGIYGTVFMYTMEEMVADRPFTCPFRDVVIEVQTHFRQVGTNFSVPLETSEVMNVLHNLLFLQQTVDALQVNNVLPRGHVLLFQQYMWYWATNVYRHRLVDWYSKSFELISIITIIDKIIVHRHNLYENMRLHIRAIPREWYSVLPREIRNEYEDW